MSIPKLPLAFLLSLYAPCQEVDYRKAHHHAYPEPPPGPTSLLLPWGGHWNPGLSYGGFVESLSFAVVYPLALVWNPLSFHLDCAGCMSLVQCDSTLFRVHFCLNFVPGWEEQTSKRSSWNGNGIIEVGQLWHSLGAQKTFFGPFISRTKGFRGSLDFCSLAEGQ